MRKCSAFLLIEGMEAITFLVLIFTNKISRPLKMSTSSINLRDIKRVHSKIIGVNVIGSLILIDVT